MHLLTWPHENTFGSNLIHEQRSKWTQIEKPPDLKNLWKLVRLMDEDPPAMAGSRGEGKPLFLLSASTNPHPVMESGVKQHGEYILARLAKRVS